MGESRPDDKERYLALRDIAKYNQTCKVSVKRYTRENKPTPTAHRPGSVEKIRELVARVERNEALFNEEDEGGGWEL